MKVLITGSSGLVGSTLVDFLHSGGHQVKKLIRGEWTKDPEGVAWDPEHGAFDPEELEGLDAIVNLAGENISSKRWNEEVKRKIRDSRVEGTKNLVRVIKTLKNPPKVLVNASATGYYGSRGDEVLTEKSSPGKGFLADVCKEWEAAADEAKSAGVRVVKLRFGVILSGRGGALQKMVLPFQLCLGGVIGDGKQYISWISIDDVIGIIYHTITHNDIDGAINAVSPNPVTNRDFTKTLGKVLNRPTLFPVPKFAADLAFGEMADETLFTSERVVSQKMEGTDYHFQYPELEGALRHQIGK